MKKLKATPSIITRDCTNFKNYLKNQFKVKNFGEFICTYTFPFDELEALQQTAAAADKKPASLRLYYGCKADGTGHKLYMSLVDEQGEIIADTGFSNDNNPNKTALASNTLEEIGVTERAMLVEAERKCPPGGTSDRLIRALFI